MAVSSAVPSRFRLRPATSRITRSMSTSASATMFWPPATSASALLIPIPPAPIIATFSVSLGATNPGPPRTFRGTMVNPKAALAMVETKLRRVILSFCMFSLMGGGNERPIRRARRQFDAADL